MKRLLALTGLLAVAMTTLLAQMSASQATLRTAGGDHRPIAYVTQNGLTYFSALDVITALGGTIMPDATGFKATLNGKVTVFGPDSRFAVVGDDLIDMPVSPITVEGTPFVPWQFFQGLLLKATDQEIAWDPAARLLTIRPAAHSIVSVQIAVTNVQGISKIVLTLSAPSDYSIAREPGAYTIRFRSPLQAPFAEQSFDDPYVAKATFAGSDLRIQLTGPDVVGDAYKLENPFRIVLDLRKGAPADPGAAPRPGTSKSIDAPGIHTIVIDPGHGGKEVGAVGPKGLMEKDVTLAVAQKLANSLQSRLGARVVLTREDDSIVSLDQRTAIANQYKADLFLSVHMNAAVVKGAKGSETYFLSLDASDDLAKRAAEIENAASVAVASSPTADLKLILWDLAQQEYLQESSRFAQVIQEEMNAVTGVQSRGVKQAPFKVLVGATMPAALVEVGFITNPEEESKLRSDDFQNMMVDALARAVQKYKTEYETRIGVVRPAPTLGGGPAATAAQRRSGT